jgi:hypothetical protein
VGAADGLTERVMTEGKVLPGNLLKVYSFINHQVGVPWFPSTDGVFSQCLAELLSKYIWSWSVVESQCVHAW